MNEAIRIRSAVPADIPILVTIERESASAAHWPETRYQEMLSQSSARTVLVAENNASSQTVGFLVAHQLRPEWELENIVVSGSEQRKGLGKRLLSAFIARVKRAAGASILLEVRESNVAARALYEKSGFSQVGARKSYYQNPLEDAILYRLDLH